jgi:hypothetical protein
MVSSLSGCFIVLSGKKSTGDRLIHAKGSCIQLSAGTCRDIVPSPGSPRDVELYCEITGKNLITGCPEEDYSGVCKMNIEIGCSISRRYRESSVIIGEFKRQW